MPRAAKGDVEKGLDADLAEIRKLAPSVATGALAAGARRIARALDAEDLSATSAASCQRALIDTLDRLREQLPTGSERRSRLDELGARRAARRSGVAGT